MSCLPGAIPFVDVAGSVLEFLIKSALDKKDDSEERLRRAFLFNTRAALQDVKTGLGRAMQFIYTHL